MTKQDILTATQRITKQLIADRRHLHRHPEMSGHERETAKYVADRLKKLGITHRTGVGGHGVVGVIKGGTAGRCIALRADMDALPITEESGVPFASQNTGVMHACGHDAHTAMLMNAAEILQKNRKTLHGSVKLIFQPSEELHPGGAAPMIADGALKKPDVDMIIAVHIAAFMKPRTFGVLDGPVMAQADEFTVTILGKGAHGAGPHSAVDPVVTAAQAVTALQTIASRRINPLERVVVSICTINGGSAFNIIPGNVTFTGTVRTFNPRVQKRVKKEMARILKGITGAAGATYRLDYEDGYPSVVNDTGAAQQVRNAVTALYGKKALIDIPPSMGGEDFTYYLHEVPGAFFRLGTGSATGKPSMAHNCEFTLDESALPCGVGVLVQTAAAYLAAPRVGSR